MAKKDYKVKNNAAVEERSLYKMSGEEKAATDPRRYLKKCSQLARSAQESL